MFKVKEVDTFTWPCKARVPVNGKYETVKFETEFRILSQADSAALFSSDDDDEVVEGGLRFLNETVVSINGVDIENAAGEIESDQDERKRILFQYPYFITAITEAYREGITGKRAKN